MLQDHAEAEANYRRFIERVKQSRQVWGLFSQEYGFVYSASNDDEERDVLVFWSDRAYAARHAREEWAEFTPVPLDLDSFVNEMLPALQENGALVGPNWDANLCGLEIEPEELAKQLLAE